MRTSVYFLIAFALVAPSALGQNVSHGVVYESPGMFAGWPANEGFWMWGDEVLVGFEVSKYKDMTDTHNVDRDAPKRILFARSKDGGTTWTAEEHPEIAPPAYLEDPSKHVQTHPGLKQPVASPGDFPFADPNFTMKMRGGTFYTSTDRGVHWNGPYRFPDFGQSLLMARTSYLVSDPKTCQVFISSSPTDGDRGQTFMAETTDGGKTFEFVSWVAPDLCEELDAGGKIAFSIMPSVIRLDDGTMLAGMRQRMDRRKWIDIYRSTDDGRTWHLFSTPAKAVANPVALVKLGGQRIAAVYGWRDPPFGVRAQISEDGGKTWSAQHVLRDDGYEWDLGYVQAGLRPDGKLLAVYYYTTDDKQEQHIEYTLWDVPPAGDPSSKAAPKSAHWNFDASGATLIDEFGSANGRVGKGVEFVVGKQLRAARFSGDECDGVLLGAAHLALNPDRADFSISGTFSASENDGPNRPIVENVHGLGGYTVFVGRHDRKYRGHLVFVINGPGRGDDVMLMSDSRVDDGRWHSFAAVVQDGTATITLDGQLQAQTARYGSGTTASAPEGISAFIGRGFHGHIDDLKIERGVSLPTATAF